VAKGLNNGDLDTKKEELRLYDKCLKLSGIVVIAKKIKNLPLMDHCPEGKDDPDEAEDGENAQYNGRYHDPAGP
jgi:hypothetical protein